MFVFQTFKTLLYILSPLLFAVILTVILLFKILRFLYRWIYQGAKVLRSILSAADAGTYPLEGPIDKAVELSGFEYDPSQDIFFSRMDSWQREFGYCRLYDEALAPFGMILDCEPIYFEYGNKNWLIELWKGQYDLTSGCEVGVYTTEEPVFNIPGVFNANFYNSAGDADRLLIAYCLKRNGKTVLVRKEKHWWLTGFKLGQYSEPSELSMRINITFKDEKMCNAFIKGLNTAGYSYEQILKTGCTVSFKFDRPHTRQPYTRTKLTDWLIQKKNKYICDRFQEITSSQDNIQDKLHALQEQSPRLYKKALKIGMTGRSYSKIKKMNKYFS